MHMGGKLKKKRTHKALLTAKKVGVSAHNKSHMHIKVGRKSSHKNKGSKKAIMT